MRYKSHHHRPRQELCTLAPAPADIYWLFYVPSTQSNEEAADDFSNLAGLIAMSFRDEMPYPDMGYATAPSHAGNGYAAEAGRQVLHYWRDLVGVKEIFVACSLENKASQRCAERIGFVRAESVINEVSPGERQEAVAYVLPGMDWREGQMISPWKGWPSDGDGTG